MKRRALTGFAAGALLSVSFVAAFTGDARKMEPAPITEVSIDGIPFHVGDVGPDASASLRQELARLGVDPAEPFDVPDVPPEAKPVRPMKPAGPGNPVPSVAPNLPRGLRAEHSLRMSGGKGTVELVYGKMEPGGTDLAARLTTGGWLSVSAGGNSRGPRIFQNDRKKEIAVVCLDEKESAFLLFRKVER